jgi:hypothetical protein
MGAPSSIAWLSDAIPQALDFGLSGAMGAAINDAAGRLNAVSNHATFAVGTTGRESLDGAFEAVERHRPAALCYLKRFVVVVAASLANSHDLPPSF